MMSTLSQKVAIVTGASSGIGRATAKLFAQEGAKVVVAARRQNALDLLVEDIKARGGSATALAGDVCDESYAKGLVDLAIDTYGRLDIAFNNAGMLGAGAATTETSMTQWDEVITTNLTSAFLGAKYQLAAMQNTGGSLIFTSSFVGYSIGMPQMAAYSASKAGLVGLTKALAAEYATDNIRVNALLPGGTNTPMAEEHMSRGGQDVAATQSFVEGLHALKRLGRPEEIAHSALYLASDASSFTTGIALLADGGVSMSKI